MPDRREGMPAWPTGVKIMWMIHKQAKVEHFQFWILHPIKFRLNALAKQLREIDEKLGPPSQRG